MPQLSLGSASAAEARPFALGLTDPVFASTAAAERDTWLDRAVASNASTVLPAAQWSAIAPAQRSSAFDPTDPADPAYNFAALDAAVRDAVAHGLDPLLLVTGTPAWAEGKNRPPNTAKYPIGTWKPQPAELKKFAVALARRYSGSFNDPADAAGPLPRVRDYQLWAEPNLAIYLNPQWKKNKAVAPVHYRKMLRGFYEGIHSVSNSNRVVTGGTAPYGDPQPGGGRMQPLRFWRELLCFKGQDLKKANCRKPAKFDVWAHHPINVGEPRREALNRDDVSTPDLGKIKRVVNKAVRSGRAQPRGKKPIWATEIWWDSKPPDPNGVAARTHARWLAESFYLLWRQGVERVYWFLIRDAAGERRLRSDAAERPLPRRRPAEARPAGLPLPVRGRSAQGQAGPRLGRRPEPRQCDDRAQGRQALEADRLGRRRRLACIRRLRQGGARGRATGQTGLTDQHPVQSQVISFTINKPTGGDPK